MDLVPSVALADVQVMRWRNLGHKQVLLASLQTSPMYLRQLGLVQPGIQPLPMTAKDGRRFGLGVMVCGKRVVLSVLLEV